MQQFNFNVQKRLFSGYLAELSYAGSLGRKQSKRRNFNQKRINDPIPAVPLPNPGPVMTSEKNSNSSYNTLQARLERQFNGGLSFLTPGEPVGSLPASLGRERIARRGPLNTPGF